MASARAYKALSTIPASGFLRTRLSTTWPRDFWWPTASFELPNTQKSSMFDRVRWFPLRRHPIRRDKWTCVEKSVLKQNEATLGTNYYCRWRNSSTQQIFQMVLSQVHVIFGFVQIFDAWPLLPKRRTSAALFREEVIVDFEWEMVWWICRKSWH